jgi:tetratricopeptide (TPR) repeat protein
MGVGKHGKAAVVYTANGRVDAVSGSGDRFRLLSLALAPTFVLLAAAFWIPPGLLYVWIVYLRRTRPVVAHALLAVVILTSVAWGYARWRSSSQYKIIRLINLGQKLAKTDYVAAGEEVKEASSLAKKTGDKKLELKSVCSLGECQAVLGDLKGSRESLDFCFLLAVDLEDLHAKSMSLVALAQLEALQSDTGHAEQYLKETHESAIDISDAIVKATVLRALGDLEQKVSNDNEASENYLNALKLYKSSKGNQQVEADILRGLGALYDKLGRNDESRGASAEAVNIYQ